MSLPVFVKRALWRMSTLLLLFVLLLCYSTTYVPSAAAADIPDTNVGFVGANTFLHKEAEDWKVERTFQMMHDAGINSIKQEFPWWEIEISAKGDFYDHKFNKSAWQKYDRIVELAEKYHISIVARLDHTPPWAQVSGGTEAQPPANLQDYADFVRAFVQHYKGRIHYIQVWNEPNLSLQWYPAKFPDAPGYVKMLKLTYQAAKAVDPTIRVMAAPLAITNENSGRAADEVDYLKQEYAAGIKPYFDILAANAYGQEFAPEDPPNPASPDSPITTQSRLNYRRVELQYDIMKANDDGNKAVWLNEYGWNDAPASVTKDRVWRAVDPQTRAQYTVDGIKYGHQNWPWLGTAFIWFFRQAGDIPMDDEQAYFAMVNTDFTPKPVYASVKQYAVSLLPTPPVPIGGTISPPTPTTAPSLTTAPVPTKVVVPTKAPATKAPTTAPVANATTAPISAATSAATNAATAPATTAPGTQAPNITVQDTVTSATIVPATAGATIVAQAGSTVTPTDTPFAPLPTAAPSTPATTQTGGDTPVGLIVAAFAGLAVVVGGGVALAMRRRRL